jgi:hypothetical protein
VETNEHLRELFGTARTELRHQDSAKEFKTEGRVLGSVAAFAARGRELGIKNDGGKADGEYADGIPVAMAKEHGRGLAVYLNFSLRESRAGPEKIASLLRPLVARAGLHPPIILTDDDGARVRSVVIRERIRGPLRYLMIYSDTASKLQGTLRVPGETYDLVQRTHIGTGQKAIIALRAQKPTVLAILPYRVEGLSLRKPDRVARGGELRLAVQVQTDGKQPSDHILRIEVTDPLGKTAEYWTKNVIASAGRWEVRWPVALNETTGKWRVSVLDVSSDAKVEGVFQVIE